MSSETLAESVQTNPVVVRRLVTKLVNAGLVRSYKGKSGGIELARPAKWIPLSEIYRATEHRAAFTAPSKKPMKTCPVSCAMAKIFSRLFQGVEQAQLKFLSSQSLADIAKQIHIDS